MSIQTLSLKQKISYAASILAFLVIVIFGIRGYIALKNRENTQKGTLQSWIPSSTRILIDSKNGDLLLKETNQSSYLSALYICEPFQSFHQYLSLVCQTKGEKKEQELNKELFLGAMNDVKETYMALYIKDARSNTLLKRMNEQLQNESPLEEKAPFHYYIYPPDQSRKDSLYVLIEKEIAFVSKNRKVIGQIFNTHQKRTSLFDNREFTQLYGLINKGGEHRFMIHSEMMPDLTSVEQGKTLAATHSRWMGWNLTLEKSEVWLTGNNVVDADFYDIGKCSQYNPELMHLIPDNTASFFLTHANAEQWLQTFPVEERASTDFWNQKGQEMIQLLKNGITGDIFWSQNEGNSNKNATLTGIALKDGNTLKESLQKWIFSISSVNKEYDPDIRKAITQPEPESIYRLPAGDLASTLFGDKVPSDSIEYFAIWKNTLLISSHPLYLKAHLENLSLGRSFGRSSLYRQWNKSLNKESDLFVFYDTRKLLPLFNPPKDHWLYNRKKYLSRFLIGMQFRSQGEYISEYMVLKYR